MNETKIKLKYEICDEGSGGIPVIIAAAGSSSRMQGINKQFMSLCGISVLARTLLAFEKSEDISKIIVVTRPEDVINVQLLAQQHMIGKLTDIVCGGDTRQESVLKGISRLKEDEEYFLIHDGARPLVTGRIIKDVVLALKKYSAVTCAVKITDTVKKVNPDGTVEKTLDREKIVAVQTPQGVKKRDYLEAVKTVDNISIFTDDTSIMEAAGYTVYITDGSYINIKITTPHDLFAAEGFLSEEEEI